MEEKRKSTGPYIINKEGQKGDRDLWTNIMTPDSEATFDRYLKIKKIGKAAKLEKEKRLSQKAFESLMESLK